eukprot:CAMPEP_0173418190 /NCGR_PEP_ID=MMETSP1357-20121228/408_1 /TAXON_ID=77926 /ORGANISM="Hemiselmis rufescens, Strain PCC563" /LENGTH=43 /DNA_ID= /DNA_START= /DNA_END= /DNA_ORIENTATION=
MSEPPPEALHQELQLHPSAHIELLEGDPAAQEIEEAEEEHVQQ